MFEDAEYHNVVFVGFDEKMLPVMPIRKALPVEVLFASTWRAAIRPTAFIIFLRIQIPITCLYLKHPSICCPT